MPLQAVESRRLYRQIADQIADLVEKGEYAAGARLPPERELAAQLGVSRPSVREALIALEVEGYVEVRVGSGVYVLGTRPAARVAPLSADSGPFELIGARRLIEGECAALAARHAGKAQVQGMEEALEAMTAAGEAPETLAHDRDFHLRVAEASGNSALALAVETLWNQRTGPLFRLLEQHSAAPGIWARAIAEHREVVDAIRRHDPAAARRAMRRHLDRAARRFSAGWGGRARGR